MKSRTVVGLAFLGTYLLMLAWGALSHYYFLTAIGLFFLAWECFWKKSFAFGVESKGNRLWVLSSLLSIYSRSDENAETLLYQKISDLRFSGELNEEEMRWVERLKEMSELRNLVFGKSDSRQKIALRQAFAYAVDSAPLFTPNFSVQSLTGEDIFGAGTVVADLYWKLYETCLGRFSDLDLLARKLYSEIFNEGFSEETSRRTIERLTDSMQRDHGIAFVVLNLLRRGDFFTARSLTQRLLTMAVEVDDEVRSTLYWISEIHFFLEEMNPSFLDYEGVIRHLYHLCFIAPQRAAFLEIDSQFFSQFEIVNELAREGFLFKESLIEKVLDLWGQYDERFNAVFLKPLESMTEWKSKIYDNSEVWRKVWTRESDRFSREYLMVVEGNLFYAGGHYEDAAHYYEKALALNPKLRPALLNLVFAYARTNQNERYEAIKERVLEDSSLMPASLYVIGNSHLLRNETKLADQYFAELAELEGWGRKVDYYQSTFCYENGLYEKALEYAEKAYARNPTDSSISYHLSLCYNALGKKAEALQMVKHAVGESTELQWLNYYRFTLERDAGRHTDATRTLMLIPSEYFQDPEELEAAIEFARSQKDLVLLRHLKRRD